MCWLINIIFTIRIFLLLTKHTCNILVKTISITAAVAAFVNPIIHCDDTQPELLMQDIGGSTIHTYAHHKAACNTNHTTLFAALNWIPFIFNLTQSTAPVDDDNIADHLCNSTFDHLQPLEEGEEWMIADSGANWHYHRHNSFIF